VKVLHAIHGFLPEYEGGTELYVRELARALEPMGHPSEVLAGSGVTAREERLEREEVDGRVVHRLRRSGGTHERWDASHSTTAQRLVDGLLRQLRPDVVHVHHWKRLTRDLVARCRAAGIPVVLTFHDLWSTCAREFRMRGGAFCGARFLEVDCERCVIREPWQEDDEVLRALASFRDDLADEVRLASARTAPTRAHRDRVAALHGLERESIRVLPLGPVRELRPCPRQGGFPDGPLRIGHWAHMDHVKGSHVLLEAVRSLPDPSRVEVHLFGSLVTEAYGARMRGLAQGLPVELHGPFGASDLERAALDVAVVPSLTAESYSYVVDEAFDLGLPVLGSDLGALPERIGSAGAVFPAGDASALAALLAAILDDPGSLARQRAAVPRRERSMEEHALEVAGLYEEARSGALPGPPVDELARERERLALARDQLDRRRTALLDLEARAQYLVADTWKLQSDLVEARERIRRFEAELGEAATDTSRSRDPGPRR